MIKSLQVGVHVTSIALIYKAIIVKSEFFLKSKIEINEHI